MSSPIITQRGLNRALLARQLLLERATMPIPSASNSSAACRRSTRRPGTSGCGRDSPISTADALTAALEDRSVIQASLMRTTIHMVSRREFWLYAMGVRRARREWAIRALGDR